MWLLFHWLVFNTCILHDVSVDLHVGKMVGRGGGRVLKERVLRPSLVVSVPRLEFWTFAKRKMNNSLLKMMNTCVKCVLLIGNHFVYLGRHWRHLHVIRWTRPSPSVFAYWKQSKIGRWEGLGTRLWCTYTHVQYILWLIQKWTVHHVRVGSVWAQDKTHCAALYILYLVPTMTILFLCFQSLLLCVLVHQHLLMVWSQSAGATYTLEVWTSHRSSWLQPRVYLQLNWMFRTETWLTSIRCTST